MSERRAPKIEAYTNGPFLVRGPIEIVGEDGTALQTHRGTVALCRCGHSAIRPLCDGSHASAHARRSATR
ncbi:MAG: CDGSH iron-sulfur domain-containing protein [Actinomycetota bacterium]